MSQSSPILVLISADAEWRCVRAFYPGAAAQFSPLGEWLEGQIRGRPAVFFHGGWGKIAAAASTQYALDRWKPALLVNLGTCGGFQGEIERGAVVLAERTLVYDIVEQMTDTDEAIAAYTTDLDLSWLGERTPQPVVRTLLVSADRDLVAGEVPQLKARYGAVAGDWESGAIAWVAAKMGVRCLILRGVTDLVGAEGGEAYGKPEVFHAATARVMESLLAALPEWVALADPG